MGVKIGNSQDRTLKLNFSFHDCPVVWQNFIYSIFGKTTGHGDRIKTIKNTLKNYNALYYRPNSKYCRIIFETSEHLTKFILEYSS